MTLRIAVFVTTMLLGPHALADLEPGRYNVKAYSHTCRLLATGVFNLEIAEPDENGRRRITGTRVFVPLARFDSHFSWVPWQLIGDVEGDRIDLDLDRNVFDSNTYVRARMIERPETGFEGAWLYSGWGVGPRGSLVAARAPAEPTKPCEDLPQPSMPVNRAELLRNVSEWIENHEQTESEDANPPDEPPD